MAYGQVSLRKTCIAGNPINLFGMSQALSEIFAPVASFLDSLPARTGFDAFQLGNAILAGLVVFCQSWVARSVLDIAGRACALS